MLYNVTTVIHTKHASACDFQHPLSTMIAIHEGKRKLNTAENLEILPHRRSSECYNMARHVIHNPMNGGFQQL